MNKLYTLLFTLCVLLNSCSQNNYDDNGNTVNNGKIEFKVEVAQAKTKIATDENFNVDFEIGDTIGIFVYKRAPESPNNEATLYAENLRLRYTGRYWVMDDDDLIYYPTDGQVLDFYAYYPYVEGVNPQALEYNASEKMVDLLHATVQGVSVSNTPLPITLRFEHVLALIDLELTKESDIPDFDDTFQARISCVVGATINLFDGTATNTVTEEIEMQLVRTGAETRRYRAWLPPQLIKEFAYSFHFIQNTAGAEIELSHKANQDVHLKKGNASRYNLSLNELFNPTHIYSLYDPFPYKGKVLGVVIMLRDGGVAGRVIGLKNIDNIQWSTAATLIGAISTTDGLGNMLKVQVLPNWQTNFPAFGWCESFGRGWHMPALNDAIRYYYNDVDIINTHLVKYNGDPINKDLFYWTATESATATARVIRIQSGENVTPEPKTNKHSVRTILDF